MTEFPRNRRCPAPWALAVVLGFCGTGIASAQGQQPTPLVSPTAADLTAGAKVFTTYCARWTIDQYLQAGFAAEPRP